VIYQQLSVEEAADAADVVLTSLEAAAVPALSSFCFCSAAAEMETAATEITMDVDVTPAGSLSCYCYAVAVEMATTAAADVADAVVAAANTSASGR